MKSVLITGASGGIGAATARLAARKGWRVLAGYRSGNERAEALAREIEASGGHARALRLDLGQGADIEEAVTAASSSSRLDAAVFCAAPALELVPFAKIRRDALEKQFAATVGHHQLLAALWRTAFSKTGGGHVIAVSTIAAAQPPAPYLSAYVAAKRALEAVVECALAEYGAKGLRATVVRLDYTETPMLTSLGEHYVEAIKAKLGDKRMLRPEEAAALIVDALDSPSEPGELNARELRCPQP